MEVSFFVVKAFSLDPLNGNPAGVVIINSPLSRAAMQRVAYINGFPETVFLLPSVYPGEYGIWWFTPTQEVQDAGHATLAAQFVINHYLLPKELDRFVMTWPSGCREVSRGEHGRLSYRAYCASVPAKRLAVNASSVEAYKIENDLVYVLPSASAVKTYVPDLSALVEMPYRGLAVTSCDDSYDYCARFFAPRYGVKEDFVTASAHVYLGQLWMEKIQKRQVTAIQYSNSHGTLKIELVESEALVYGSCALYSKGVINL